jgi:hypothetical protein
MPAYQIIRIEKPVGSGVTGAQWASVRAVLKRNTPDDPYCVANELICGHLGQFLGLPIPPHGLFQESSGTGNRLPWFGTLNFNLAGDSLPPADADDCVNAYSDENAVRPDVVTGTLLFDIWVANGDRHAHNLALDTSVVPHQLHVFDQSWALLGRTAKQGVARLHQLRNELGVSDRTSASGNRHCLLDRIRSTARFAFWFQRIRELPDYVLSDAVDRAVSLGLVGGAEAMAALSFLRYRQENLPAIVTNGRAEFSNIPPSDWGEP